MLFAPAPLTIPSLSVAVAVLARHGVRCSESCSSGIWETKCGSHTYRVSSAALIAAARSYDPVGSLFSARL